MKLIWTRELDVQNPWEPDFHGVFFYQESGIPFYYKDEHLVRCVHGQMDEPEILFEGKQGISPPLPHDWMIIKQDDALSLLCGERIAIELKTGRSKIPAPDNLQSEYQRRKPSPEHFVEDSFVLNEYQVRHKGEWGYICQKDGQDIWKFGGRGYLYTDLRREGNNLYFGTAGAGGYFYILNIHTGVPILSLRTGGTTVIQRRGSHAYLYTGVGQRKSQLICVDLISGNILDEMELPGIASDDRVLGLWEDCIYTMTFEYKSKRYYDQVKNVIYSCIALD